MIVRRLDLEDCSLGQSWLHGTVSFQCVQSRVSHARGQLRRHITCRDGYDRPVWSLANPPGHAAKLWSLQG